MAPEQRIGVIVQTNRTGASLPRTVAAALALLLPLQPEAPPAAKAALELTAEDLSRHTGVYQNGAERMEIVVKEHRLFLKRANREAALVKRSTSRYSVGATELEMVPGSDGRTGYIEIGTRAFARR